MTEQNLSGVQPLIMTDRELQCVIDMIYSQCGISLNLTKKRMASARLSKRLRKLGHGSFSQYLDYVKTPEGQEQEMTSMIDVITTNTTQFFREDRHFSFLAHQALPKLLAPGHRDLTIWSAGCSSGEEPYSIAMVLSDYFEREMGSYSIIATDISTRVLQKAQQGVYEKAAIDPVPYNLKHKYLMRGSGSQDGNYRVVPELRENISFRRVNLVDECLDLGRQVDIIFCRNVTIYFDNPTKTELFKHFYEHLVPGGYFFIGHSETLNGFNRQFIPVAPTIYRKPG